MASGMRSVSELADLHGRRALVAGGAGHIGSVACETLAELGAAVAVVDIDGERAQAIAGRIGGEAIVCDLADEGATRAAVVDVADRLGGLDVLIHCAALVGSSELAGWSVPFDQQSVAAWRHALDVNLTSAFVLSQQAAPLLRSSGHGSIVLFGSIYGTVGPDLSLYTGTEMATPAGYAASKSGLVGFARYLATTLAPDVRVNAISPGGIERGQPDSFRAAYRARTPLGRMGTEEDLKGAIAFLAGDLSAYVTGHELIVDGGWTAW
jgi:NAD(P)-dependent dehydrogenase (short-subunit alcohol dehydrogenase family)